MAKVLPLKGKYYGTKVQFTKPGSSADDDVHEITIWAPDHFADPFGSEREIEQGWGPEDGHDHVEDQQSLTVAKIIAEALTKAGF